MTFLIGLPCPIATFVQKSMEKMLLLGRNRDDLLKLVEAQKFTKVIEGDFCCLCGCKYKVAYYYQDETSETYLCQDCSKKYDPKFSYGRPKVYRG